MRFAGSFRLPEAQAGGDRGKGEIDEGQDGGDPEVSRLPHCAGRQQGLPVSQRTHHVPGLRQQDEHLCLVPRRTQPH